MFKKQEQKTKRIWPFYTLDYCVWLSPSTSNMYESWLICQRIKNNEFDPTEVLISYRNSEHNVPERQKLEQLIHKHFKTNK